MVHEYLHRRYLQLSFRFMTIYIVVYYRNQAQRDRYEVFNIRVYICFLTMTTCKTYAICKIIITYKICMHVHEHSQST